MSPPLKTDTPRGACDSVLKPAGSYRRGGGCSLPSHR